MTTMTTRVVAALAYRPPVMHLGRADALRHRTRRICTCMCEVH